MTKLFIPEPISKQLEAVKAERISSIDKNGQGHHFAHFRLPDGRTFKWQWMPKQHSARSGKRTNLNNRCQLRKFLHLKLNIPLLGKDHG